MGEAALSRVLARFALHVAGATLLGLAVVGAVVVLVALLDGSAVSLPRLIGQVVLLSPLITTLAAAISVAGLRVRGELVVLALVGRHPGGWSLAAALGAGAMVLVLVGLQASLPVSPAAAAHVSVEAHGARWRSADGTQQVWLGAGDDAEPGERTPRWRPLQPAVGPGYGLAELLDRPATPDRQAWLMLVLVLPVLAGGSALAGALAETVGLRGRSLGALAVTGSVWLLSLTLTVVAAKSLLPTGMVLFPLTGLLVFCAYLWGKEARYSATT